VIHLALGVIRISLAVILLVVQFCSQALILRLISLTVIVGQMQYVINVLVPLALSQLLLMRIPTAQLRKNKVKPPRLSTVCALGMFGRLFRHVVLTAATARVVKIQPTMRRNISVHVNILMKIKSPQKALF
jgi:hypothetical protein